ncbi:Rtr1/RPAP2 family-domain-containing protein [Hypoxylon fuscum]|nr:Rtr1/RPAP2 family-domain-containing protein [Hypoxylon fuscum]
MSSPASSKEKKPKGILKKPTTATAATLPAPVAAVSPLPLTESQPNGNKPSAREVAIQQALVIQQQHALQDEIQDSIIELSHFPLVRSSSHASSNPSPSDADAFRRLVRLFQPGDYEDMIEERNACGLCGYALCAKPRIKLSKGGEFKLVNFGKKDFNIVPRKELERWCSQQCARRAMYVKVQLNESAAGERAGIPSIQIELFDEPKQEHAKDEDAARRLAKELQDLEVDKERKGMRDAAELALERGDTTKEKQVARSIQVTIKEKAKTAAAQEPKALATDEEGHLILDGYKTRFDPKSEAITKGSTVQDIADRVEDFIHG